VAAPLRVLLVEDSENDAALILRELRRGGFDPIWERVEDAVGLGTALDKGGWDVVVTDYHLPRFSGSGALALVRERGLDVPTLVVSGSIGEEDAVGTIKAGACDYLMKDRLTRLPSAVERELREARIRSRVREYERWRQDFLRTISHEIRTPLTSIRSFVEILRESVEDPNTRREFLGIIEGEADRLNELLEDLLLVSNPGEPPRERVLARVPLAEALERARDRFAPEARERGIEMDIAVPSDLPAVLGGREDLSRVLVRLFRVAGRVTGRGERVEVRAGSRGAEVTCTISMGGVGVPRSEWERIFEPFGLDPDSPSDLPKGSGLALPLCRELLGRMGGWVALGVGAGGRCMFHLTFSSAEPAREQRASTSG
jgi:two-component system sensor histidine kinase EvgS